MRQPFNKERIQEECKYFIKKLQKINVRREDIAENINRSYPMLNCQIAGDKNSFTFNDLTKLKEYYKIKKDYFIKTLLAEE